MAITSPRVLRLLRTANSGFDPRVMLGRSTGMVSRGSAWGLAADQAGAEVGPSTRTAVDLGLAGAQGEPDAEALPRTSKTRHRRGTSSWGTSPAAPVVPR